MKIIIGLLFATLALFSVPENAKAFPTGVPIACGYTPPLDVTSGAAVAYSFRLLKTGYNGNVVTIQRSSDSTQKSFTALPPTCTINTADSFFDSSTYTVVTWFDQSGNGVNATQATNSLRPTLTLNCRNGHPCSTWVQASTQQMAATLSPTFSASTYAAVASLGNNSVAVSVIAEAYLDNSNHTALYQKTGPNCVTESAVAASATMGTISCAYNTWYRWIGTNNNTLRSVYLNGTKGTDSTTSITIPTATSLWLGRDSGITSTYMDGNIAELIIYAPDISIANSNIVSANQGAYWGL